MHRVANPKSARKGSEGSNPSASAIERFRQRLKTLKPVTDNRPLRPYVSEVSIGVHAEPMGKER